MRNNRGFTLLEVMIAITILGVGIIAVMQLFPQGLRQARVAAERTVVTRLASTKLDQVRAFGADNLLRHNLPFNARVSLQGAAQQYSLYSGWETTVHRTRDAAMGGLQRVTFSVKMADGRYETFVTYVARQ